MKFRPKYEPFIPKMPKIPLGFILIVDSREIQPLFLPKPPIGLIMVRDVLESGDYSIQGFENSIGIERKNLSDLYISLGKDRPRFTKELKRLVEYEWKGLVIEDTEDETLTPQSYSGMNVNSVYGSLVSMQVHYGLHIYYAKNKHNAEAWTLNCLVQWYKAKRGIR